MLSLLIKCIRPFLGPEGCCKFELPCTDFALLQLKENSLLKACFSIIFRLLLCNPLVSFYLFLLNFIRKHIRSSY